MHKRLIAALTAYAILGVIAWFVLEGNFRYAVLILFGLFAMRSVVAIKGDLVLSRNELSQNETQASESGSEPGQPDR
jgi:uncharacterized membrane protein YeiB